MEKKNLGAVLALYPTPVTVVGAMVAGKPNWMLVAHVGIMGHDHIMISCVKSHYTNQGIRDNKIVSVSLVDEKFLPKADYTGCVSGSKEDKSRLFAYEMGEAGAPVPKDVPLSMECEVADIYETKGFDNFILKIRNTYAKDEILGDNGKISYEKIKPVLFAMVNYEYLSTGNIIGKCMHMNDAK